MWSDLFYRLRGIFRRKAVERELDDELSFHISCQKDKYIAAGLSPIEAERQARLEFGGIDSAKEACRDERAISFAETTIQDIRYAIQKLRNEPGFSLVAILALALGIGATTATFGVVNAVLLKPLNLYEPGRLVTISESNLSAGLSVFPVTADNFLDWQHLNTTFEHIAAYNSGPVTLSGDGNPERIVKSGVSQDFFSILKVRAQIGRTLDVQDYQRGNAAVISDTLWHRRFGGDASVLKATIELDGRVRPIVGVMPPGFDYPLHTDTWSPLVAVYGDNGQRTGWHGLQVIGRLKQGIGIRAAAAEMKLIAAQLEQQHPESNKSWTANVTFLLDDLVQNLRGTILILFGTSSLILLIACANVANLLLARGLERQQEIALRTALGAGRLRLLKQLLTESVVLALIGGGLGILFSYVLLDLMVAMAPANLPRMGEIKIDLPVLGFCIVISVVTGIAFGLFPAAALSRTNLIERLKSARVAIGSGTQQHRIHFLLAVVQIGLTIIVVTGAGLMIQSLHRLAAVDPGFDTSNILAAELSLPTLRYFAPERQIVFLDQLLQRVGSLPGVEAAAGTTAIPLTDSDLIVSFAVDGRVPAHLQDRPVAQMRNVTANYFDTLRIPVIRGRGLTAQDRQSSSPVIVINEALAKQFFPDSDPIAQRLVIGLGSAPREIVGVVRDIKDANLRSEAVPTYYVPFAQSPSQDIRLVIRSSGNHRLLASSLREQVAALDTNLAVAKIQPMSGILDSSLSPMRFTTTLLAVFAAVGMTLAGIGVFAVMSYIVYRRTHEFAIRIAVGAGVRDVLAMVFRGTVTLTGLGVIAGVAGSLALTRLLHSMVFEIAPNDPFTILAAALTLIVVTFAATLVPARRATKVNPLSALKCE